MSRGLPLVVLLLVSIVAVPAAFAQSNEETEREIIRLEHDLVDAYTHNDMDAVKRLVPEDYVSIGNNGESSTRDTILARYKSGELHDISNDLDQLKVRLYGNTAIVTGINHNKTNYKNEQIFKNKLFYIRVYIRRDGRWQPVATHYGQISPF